RLMLQASAGGSAAARAVAEAQQVTAQHYVEAAEDQKQLEGKLVTDTDSSVFLEHLLADRMDAINPAVVSAFMRTLCGARGWVMKNWLHDYLYQIEATPNNKLPAALGGGHKALIAVSMDALTQARHE